MTDLPSPVPVKDAGLIQNDTAREYPDNRSVADLFSEWARRTPDAIAVSGGGNEQHISYGDLDAWSDRLAVRLAEAGTAAGEPVGLLGGRCPEAPAAMLAILKAGACYVPLDRDDPLPRRRALAGELGIRRVVTMPGSADRADGMTAFAVEDFRTGTSQPPPPVRAGGADPAYILFTSGSTGPPKAVAVPHRAIARLVINTNYVHIGAQDRVSNAGHPSFDASVFEIWGALLNGARLIVVDTATLLHPASFEALLRRSGVTVMCLSTGVFHVCARARPAMFASVRYLITGGDVLIPEVAAAVLRAGRPGHLVNGYGPTENTTFSTTYEITEVPAGTARIPIGTPIANSTCYILAGDEPSADAGAAGAVALAPDGEEGELAVGGAGVAIGYVNSPALTAEKFIPDPFSAAPGARLFRTGDRARRLPDGTIDFLGRRDRMIKLRDFRIELGEVEAMLSDSPLVGEAAVGTAGRDPATMTIVGYYTDPPGGAAATPAQLRRYLAERLPSYMLPAQFVRLGHFPLTPAGKLDRVALAAIAAARAAAPRTPPGDGAADSDRAADGGAAAGDGGPVQAGLARLWEEILGVAHVGPQDDFFDLGGNSLLAAQVFARLQTIFGVGLEQSRFLTGRLLADASLAACAEAVRQARALTRGPAGAETDFAAQAQLGPLAPPVPGRAADPAHRVLLTGGSGFLGSYLLRELLGTSTAQITCLVRADDDGHAMRRLAAAQQRAQLGELPPGRVTALAADLGSPLLGLTEAQFGALGAEVDLVLHCGAFVNFTYPYAQLARVTVAGTRELIRLAARLRGAPVHFVSSLAVLAGPGAAGVPEVTEDTPAAFPEYLHLGYSETKWVAEALLARAAEAGLPTVVYRPYEISGDLVHGAWNAESATCAMFRVIADTGCAPDVDLPLDFVPVDVLARQITHIARARPAVSGTYHLANPRPAMLREMTERLTAHGYPVRTVPLDTWVAEATRLVCTQPGHPFAPFVPLWLDREPRSGLTVKEMFFAAHFPRFGTARADAALAGSGIELPPVDAALLDSYIRFFQRSGFLMPPPGGMA